MSKLKILSIAICCLVSALWTEIQGAEEYNASQSIGSAFIKTANQFLIDPRGVLENPDIQTARIESLQTALQDKETEISNLREQLEVSAREAEQQRLLKDKMINSLSGRLNNPNSVNAPVEASLKHCGDGALMKLCSRYKYAFENNEKIINEVILELSK